MAVARPVRLRAEGVCLDLPTELQRQSPGDGRMGTVFSSLFGRERLQRTILSDIDFHADDGDRIGVLGLNGAGKTTLLRVLNGAFPPSRGRIEREGTMQSLLNPTLGFEEHATVVENVFLRGTAMGLRVRQLRPALGSILEFAGLERRGGYELHTLSSGQRMRLGFAISTAVQPDILLMDEWLSTGDAAFLDRAQTRMQNRFHGSRIVVLASHSTTLIRSLCNKAIVLEDGRMRCFAPVEDALEHYRELVAGASEAMQRQLAQDDPLLFGAGTGMVERIRVLADAIEVSGWAVDAQDGEVRTICVQLEDALVCSGTFERIERADVLAFVGRRHGRLGFRIALPIGRRQDTSSLAERLRVTTGESEDRQGAPLPVAHGCVRHAPRVDDILS